MTWHDPHPDTAAEFSNQWYDDLDAEQAQAEALADRLSDFTAPSPLLPRGEARPLTTAERGPDALPYPRARRDRPSSSERAA